MLFTDRAPTTGTLARLSDRRVQQYYDPDRLLAKRLRADARAPQPIEECCTSRGVLWDVIAIYPGDARWGERAPVATFFNGPVVDVIEGLKQALREGEK